MLWKKALGTAHLVVKVDVKLNLNRMNGEAEHTEEQLLRI
jgi:hypothetical protein